MASKNQSPEQKARDNIDAMLEQVGWKVQAKKEDGSRLPWGRIEQQIKRYHQG